MSLQTEIYDCADYRETCSWIRDHGFLKYKNGYERIVFTNGCFDIIHAGHLSTLKHAHELAGPRGAVVVGINDDESVKRLKGDNRPILNEQARGSILATMRYVDHVISFQEDTPFELISVLLPDIIVKGGDYDALNVIGKNISQISIAPFDDRWSTTDIIKKIKES